MRIFVIIILLLIPKRTNIPRENISDILIFCKFSCFTDIVFQRNKCKLSSHNHKEAQNQILVKLIFFLTSAGIHDIGINKRSMEDCLEYMCQTNNFPTLFLLEIKIRDEIEKGKRGKSFSYTTLDNIRFSVTCREKAIVYNFLNFIFVNKTYYSHNTRMRLL